MNICRNLEKVFTIWGFLKFCLIDKKQKEKNKTKQMVELFNDAEQKLRFNAVDVRTIAGLSNYVQLFL